MQRNGSYESEGHQGRNWQHPLTWLGGPGSGGIRHLLPQTSLRLQQNLLFSSSSRFRLALATGSRKFPHWEPLVWLVGFQERLGCNMEVHWEGEGQEGERDVDTLGDVDG